MRLSTASASLLAATALLGASAFASASVLRGDADDEVSPSAASSSSLDLADLARVAENGNDGVVATVGAGRALMGGMEEHPAFAPLPCNAPVDVSDTSMCANWSEQGYDASDVVTVPCGACVKLDAATAGTLDLPGGLNVEGKLVVDVDELGPDYAVDIRTPFVVVQGVLDVTSTARTVSPSNEAVRFTMTGPVDADLDLAPMIHEHNAMACEAMCGVGKKPFAVVGGRLDVRALPAGCPSWTRVEDIVARPMAVPAAGEVEEPSAPNAGCDPSGLYLREDFTVGAGWNGHWAGYELTDADTPGDQYIRVTDRGAVWQGPMTNVDPACLVPDAMYVVRARLKLELSPDFVGTETSCQATGDMCPQGVYHHKEVGGANPTWNGFGREGTVYPGDGIWYDYTAVVKFSAKETTPGDMHRLWFDGPEAGVDMLMDDFSMTLAGPEYFHAASPQTCSELVVNGGADNDFANPVYSNNGKLEVRTEQDAGGADSRYFSVPERSADWHSLEVKIPPACAKEGDVYTYSMKIRVHSADPVVPMLNMMSTINPSGATQEERDDAWDTIGVCSAQSLSDGWVTCSVDHAFNAHQAAAALVKYYLVLPGDADSPVDYDDVSASFKSGAAEGVTVPPDALPCWGVGSEVLFTSHTLQFDDVSVRTVAATSTDAVTGGAVLELSEPVSSALITQRDVDANPGVALATEVALLTRNVVLDSADVAAESKQGAHMIVYHTPGVAQTVEGVEVRRFGQAGTLGRYPMHFHMCGDVDGSQLTKNVVRDSFQRCYVIHGSHNVTLTENVAYETFGHCYFLEDSAEEDNVFLRNLGAVTRKQPSADMITKQPETDHEPSTFWMTNPQNTWEGNVAAGSEHSGVWFEMRTSVRGPSAKLPENEGKNPKILPLKLFRDNVMHSNHEHGLKTYPGSGYEPDVEAVFSDTKSYRNKGSGVFFHNSRNLALEGGFYSDNRRQVDFDRAPTTRISDAKVTGYSPLYRDTVQMEGGNWYHYHCPSQYPLVGVQLHAFWSGGDKARGSTVENVSFEHLGEETGCDGSRAINVDAENKGYFDIRTSVGNLAYDSSTEKFEACTALTDGGIDFVAINDEDGSVAGQPGYIVSDSAVMTGLLPDGLCSPLPDTCALICPGTCLRSRLLRVSGLTDDGLSLVVTDTSDPSRTVEIYGYFERNFLDVEETLLDVNENTLVWKDRLFHVVVPDGGGPYSAVFKMNGQDYWPRFVEEVDQDVPGNCGGGTFPTINVVMPPVPADYCDDLIHNGDMEAGFDGWQNNGGGLALESEGVTGQALKSDVRTSSWNGPGQFLDTRCLVEGETYQFTAKVKLARESDGSDPGCDVHGDNGGCPKVAMIVQIDSDPEVRDWVSIGWGTETGSWSDGEWNTIRNTFTITSSMASAESTFIYFEGPPDHVDIIIDDVSIVKYVEEEVVCGSTIMNETFTSSIDGWNGNWNPGGFELSTADSHTQDDSYLWVKGRSQRWQGPMDKEFDFTCMVPDTLYFLSAKFKYEMTPEYIGTEINCETDVDYCVQAVYYRKDSADQAHWRGFGGKKQQAAGMWFEYHGAYTFTADDLTPGNAHRLYFDGPEKDVDIMIDDVYLREAPVEFFPTGAELCNELCVNGGADIAPPFTFPARANAWKTYLTGESELVDGLVNNFFRINGRYGNWHSAEYDLPTECITPGEVYTFSVKLRANTATSVHPKVIIKAEPQNEYKLVTWCPYQSEVDGWVLCTADYTWTDAQGSADRVKFWIEINEDVNAVIDYDDFSFAPKV